MGLFVRDNGTKIYLAYTNVLQEAALSPAWTVDGTTYTTSITFTGGVVHNCVYLGDNGNELYLGETTGINTNVMKVRQWNLATAWDTSGISQTSDASFTVPVRSGSPTKSIIGDISFNLTGSEMYVNRNSYNGTGWIPERLRFTLFTAWDVSTAALAETTLLSSSNLAEYLGSYHLMSGGEYLLSTGGNIYETASIPYSTVDSFIGGFSQFRIMDSESKLYGDTGCGTISYYQTNYAAGVLRPTVTSQSGTFNSGGSTVTANGNVVSDGGGTITERGFYYDIDNPNVRDTDAKQVVSGTTGAFSFNIPVIQQGSAITFYYRAFARNSVGEKLSNTTQSVTIPAS